MKQKTIWIVIGLVLVILIGLFAFLFKTGKIKPLAAGQASLTFNPSSLAVNVSNSFSVALNLDTDGANVQGVDIQSLHYNPAILELTGYSQGDFAQYMGEDNNKTAGTFKISALTAGSNVVTGRVRVLTLNFLSKAQGSSNVTLDYSASASGDSAVWASGVDVLASVGTGSYSVNQTTQITPSTQVSSGSGGGGGGGTSPRPRCGGPKQPACPPSPVVTQNPTPEETQTQIVVRTSTPQPVATATPTPAESVSFLPILDTSPIFYGSPEPTKVAGFGISTTAWVFICVIAGIIVVLIVYFLVMRSKKKNEFSEDSSTSDNENDIL